MSTPLEQVDQPVASEPVRPTRMRWAFAGVAAAAVLVAGVVGVAVVGGGEPERSAPPIAFNLPASDGMMSCVQFSEEFLAPMPVAFAATATEVREGSVLLEVDRWFRAGPQGEADQVELRTPAVGSSALLDGIEFTQGERYLVTATDGNVNGCGFSGVATPELEAMFERAFA